MFAYVRPSGLIAISLEEDDRLGWVKMTEGGQDLILVSEQGRGIRFSEEDVRPMGRNAIGVYAMRLDAWDHIAGADVVTPEGDVLVITEKGYGKRTAVDEYRTQGRYGQGVRAMVLTPERSAEGVESVWRARVDALERRVRAAGDSLAAKAAADSAAVRDSIGADSLRRAGAPAAAGVRP